MSPQRARPRRAAVAAALVAVLVLPSLAVPAASAQEASCVPGVTAWVEPACAPQGETVTLTVHNGTEEFLVLPSSCLWQAVFADVCGGPFVIVPYCLHVLTLIPPGESLSSTWDQRDQDGNQVPPGTYVFSVHDLCCVPFTVCGTCLSPPAKYGEVSYGTWDLWPRIDTAGGMPVPGNADFAITLSFAMGGAPALLLLGAAPAAQGFGWGTLYVSPAPPFLTVPLVLDGTPGAPGEGSIVIHAPVPASPTLLGLSAYAEFLVKDAGGPGGLTHTQGLRITICGP